MNEMCDKLWQEIQNERSRVQNLESESLKLVQENEGLKEYIISRLSRGLSGLW